MRQRGLRGVIRGKSVRTPVPDAKAPCPRDRVNRPFRAERPNPLWVSDFTYVSTWQGFVYVAFVIDVFARCVVGWRVSASMKTDFVLDALEQALYARAARRDGELVHHCDRGSQYVSICYSERLAEAGIEPSVGRIGDRYDNALAETINGLYKAELIHRRAPLEDARGGRTGHARMGLVVQPPSTARTPGLHPARRSRGKLLAATGSRLRRPRRGA